MEPAVKIRDLSASFPAVENRACGYRGYSESFADLFSGEVVPPARG